MEALRDLYQEMSDWLSSPFKKDMPIGQLLLIFVLFLIVAFIVWDALKILQDFMKETTETVIDAVT